MRQAKGISASINGVKIAEIALSQSQTMPSIEKLNRHLHEQCKSRKGALSQTLFFSRSSIKIKLTIVDDAEAGIGEHHISRMSDEQRFLSSL